ncbi:hypothetical protein AMTR_s00102p00088420 [Amborella trichopoda]|uniref:Uncharacterized protein n=1 Tax=Amborella trichopoda TaxID=13333 RepID=W1NT77_AMBTC|nr:hypothetical protein AMTR_s00102p00088420 [Amborella trichopoda]
MHGKGQTLESLFRVGEPNRSSWSARVSLGCWLAMAVRYCDLRMASLDSPDYEESLPMNGKPPDPKVNDVVSLLGS